jgi:hypothetical protein
MPARAGERLEQRAGAGCHDPLGQRRAECPGVHRRAPDPVCKNRGAIRCSDHPAQVEHVAREFREGCNRRLATAAEPGRECAFRFEPGTRRGVLERRDQPE